MNYNYKTIIFLILSSFWSIRSIDLTPTLAEWKSFEKVASEISDEFYQKIKEKRCEKQSLDKSPRFTAFKNELRKISSIFANFETLGKDPVLEQEEAEALFIKMIESGDTLALESYLEMSKKHSLDLNKTFQSLESRLRYGSKAYPSLLAVHHQKLGVISMLLKYGAHKNMDALLELACEDGDQALVEILLHHGAPVDTLDEWGETLLMRGVHVFSPSIVRLLLQKDASSLTKKDKHGRTVFDYVIDRPEIIRLLRDEWNALPATITPSLVGEVVKYSYEQHKSGKSQLLKEVVGLGDRVNPMASRKARTVFKSDCVRDVLLGLAKNSAEVQRAEQLLRNDMQDEYVRTICDARAQIQNQSIKN